VPADSRPVGINRTSSLNEKLAAVFYDQFVMSGQGKIEAAGAVGLEDLKFRPGNIQGREAATALPAAF
jgi:hypothetical protein